MTLTSLSGVPLPSLYLVRHGQTSYNRDGKIRGWDDVPLDKHGKKSAKAAAEDLAGKGIECIYCSDLKRAEDTASIIAEIVGSEVEVRQALRPWNLGHYQGEKIEEVRPGLAYYSQWPDRRVPGGEAFRSFFSRWVKFLAGQMADSARGEKIAIVVHVRHFLSLPAALAKIRGDACDITGIPTTGGPGPGAIRQIVGNGVKIIRKGDAKGKGGS